LAVVSDGQCGGNDPADFSGVGNTCAQTQRAEKGKPSDGAKVYHDSLLSRRQFIRAVSAPYLDIRKTVQNTVMLFRGCYTLGFPAPAYADFDQPDHKTAQ